MDNATHEDNNALSSADTDKETSDIHDYVAQDIKLKSETARAFTIWLCIMLIAFGFFISLRYV